MHIKTDRTKATNLLMSSLWSYLEALWSLSVNKEAIKPRSCKNSSKLKLNLVLSYDVAVIQWITSCHKSRTTTHVLTLWRVRVTSLTTSVSTMRFHIELMFILKAIKSNYKGSYDKQNLTLMVISYEIYETGQRLVS